MKLTNSEIKLVELVRIMGRNVAGEIYKDWKEFDDEKRKKHEEAVARGEVFSGKNPPSTPLRHWKSFGDDFERDEIRAKNENRLEDALNFALDSVIKEVLEEKSPKSKKSSMLSEVTALEKKLGSEGPASELSKVTGAITDLYRVISTLEKLDQETLDQVKEEYQLKPAELKKSLKDLRSAYKALVRYSHS